MKTKTKNWIWICVLVFISFCSHTISAQTTSLIETQRNNNVELGRPLIAQTVDSTDMYEFVFYNTDLSFSRLITSVDQILYFQEYSGLPEYLPMQVCVRTKKDDNWSDYGDTCTLTLVSDCAFMKEYRETVNTAAKMLKSDEIVNNIASIAATIDLDLVDEITIPVVFHVIVPPSFNGTPYEYLPPAKINEVIQILNDVYAGIRSNQPEAANCKIKFCPAMNYRLEDNTLQSLACTDQGITYYGITYNVQGESDINLPDGFLDVVSDVPSQDFVFPYQTYFPVEEFMGFYIFDLLNNPTAAGSASSVTFGSAISYIKLRRVIVGSNNSITRYEGYTAPHEAGHYFGLDHTWGGIYSNDSCGVGDYIYDTPPHAGQNMDCNELSNTCPDDDYNDPVHNIMNYTSDGCRNHFTKGQAEWMHAVIQTYLTDLPYLNTEDFDIYCDPIPCIENASIEGPAENIRCTGEANIEVFVNTATDFSLSVYDNTTSMLIYELEKIDFTPCDNNYCVDFDFTIAGTYELILNVEAETTYSQTYERIYTIIDCDTLDQNLDRAHWHFDYKANLDFTSGLGQLGETEIHALPAEVSVCSPTGELLFYTNGRDVWNRNHEIQSTQLDGNFEASKGIIALDFGENAGTRKYMMVYLNDNFNLYYRFIKVDASYNISFAPLQTQLITSSDLTNLNLELDAMGVSATPKPDETGYWLLSSLKSTTSENYFPISVEIDLTALYTGSINTSSAILSPSTAPLQSEFETIIKMSPNGKYVVYCSPYGSNVFLIFNAQTGEFNAQTECHINNIFVKFFEVAFSSDSRYMYMTELTDTTSSNSIDSVNMFYRIKQVDLEAVDACACNLYGKIIFETNSLYDHTYYKTMFYLQEGPDDRIYFSRYSDVEAYSKYMGIIMHPENAATFDPTDNECGVFGDFIHYPSNEFIKNDLYLPNFVDAKPDTCDLDFTICSSNCDELEILNLSHGEDSSFTWTLDNGANSYQFLGYTPSNLSALPYSDTWTITLSQTGCTDSLTDIVILNGVNADITGSDTICNDGQSYIYSCSSGISTYHWSLNGTPFPIFEQNTDVIITGEDYSSYVGSTMSLTLYVTNQFGCESWDTLDIYVTGFGYDVISSSDCSQPISGQVQINITGNIGTNYYADIDGNNYPVIEGVNDLFTGLYPGIHTYSVSDDYCLYQGEFETYSELHVDNTVIATYCPQDTSTITVYFSGGNSPYIVTYNSVTDTITEDSITIAGLPYGNFTFSVTDSFGCELDTTLTMAYNYPSIDFYMSGENYCSNDNNVNLVGIVEGGTPAFTYQWGEYQHPIIWFGSDNFLEEIPSFPEALYLTVTDINGCQVIDSLIIPSVINSDINLDIDVINPCRNLFDGSMELTISGSDTVSEFCWLIPDGNGGVDTIFNQEAIYNLTNVGIYRVHAWDEFRCLYHTLNVINTYDEPIVQQPICSWDEGMGRILTNWSIPPTAGYYYDSWDWLTTEYGDSIIGNNVCFDTLPGGTYVLHHTDEQGCVIADTIIIIELDSLEYSLDVDYYSDSLGNPLFTSTISVWGESLPYEIIDYGPGPVHTCYGACDFTVLQDTEQPAVYQVTGNLNECPGISTTIPYFQLFPENELCGLLYVEIFDNLPDLHDTIYFDTIVKPTKCLAAGYGNGALQVFNISTEQDIYPVFFASANDTIVYDGTVNDTLNIGNLGTGTFAVYYWNAFSSVNSFTVNVVEAWDHVLSGTITTGTHPGYGGQVIAVDGIEVESLASLTFKDCTIYTASKSYGDISDTEWLVNIQGKLVISNTIIEAGCPQKWQGINVDGNRKRNHNFVNNFSMGKYFTYQGYLVIQDNSYLYDAEKAVYVDHGAALSVTNSSFYNNNYSIYIESYSQIGLLVPVYNCYINYNEFIIDSLLYTTGGTGADRYPATQVHIDGSAEGISLLGNKFEHTYTDVHPSDRGYAVYTNNSRVNIKPYSGYESIINGFNYGIKSNSSSASLRIVDIEETDFNHNVHSVDIRNHLAPVIESNNIDAKVIYTGPPAIRVVSIGLYLDACDQYKIELNNFKNITYGAYIRNSGENYNLLYKNDFDSVTYPAIANLKNSNFVLGVNPGETGLEMKCNDFDHFNYAISVTGNMQKNQGSPNGGSSALAGNRFYTPTTTSLESEFIVSTSNPSLDINYYDYHHHNDILCIPDKHTPLKVYTYVDVNSPFYENDACPDNPEGAKVVTKSTNNSLFDIYTAFDDSISFVISDKQTELQQLVDNGNTLLLQAKAATMNNANYNEIIQSLDLDGMLSDEVVLELMQNTMAPDAAKTIALINNSPLPQKGKDHIDEMTDVDANLRAILLQYQEGKNSREIKEAEIGNLRNEKRKNISELIKYIAYENYDELNAQLIEFLEGQNTVNDNKIALRFALTDTNYHKADEILNNLHTMAQIMNIDKKTELENYIKLQAVAINTERNTEFSDSIISANSEFLFNIASDTLLIECAQAQALLEHIGLAEYPPVVYPPIVDNNKNYVINDQSNAIKTPANVIIKIYPNPANETLFVEYLIFEPESEKYQYIEIFKETGELIEKIQIIKQAGIIPVDIRNFTPAIYMIKLNKTTMKFTKM